MKHWAYVVIIVLVACGALQWRQRVRDQAVAEERLKVSRANTQAALEAQSLTIEQLAFQKRVTDAVAETGDSAAARYRRAREQARKLSASAGKASGGAGPDQPTAGADTSKYMWVERAWIESIDSALIAADELANRFDEFKAAAMAERAAADNRFAADARVIESLREENRQLEILLKEQRPGLLERAADVGEKGMALYGLFRLVTK